MNENWKDILYLKPFRKRYKAKEGLKREDWDYIMRRYGNYEKEIESSGYRWRVISYDDGRKELAYLRVLSGGIFTGRYPAIYRGIIIPKMITYQVFSHIKDIRLAF